MNKSILRAMLLVLSLGASGNATAQTVQLKGSDTLEDITKDLIGLCGLTSTITYLGGGSGTGQAAMVGGTQQIAPMSRQLNSTACTGSAGQFLLGLDGIAVTASNQLFGDSLQQTPDTNDDCTDTISGGVALSVPGCTAADGCSPDGTYTFTSWKDVLATIYGGQNHTTAAQLISGARNPARINCASAVRQALVNDWNAIYSDTDPVNPQTCRSLSCTRLKHAFRRGDSSGTTDTFVSLVGMVAIPPLTTTFDSVKLIPTRDANATANPFCNAGEAKMNKGDSDYLDLDPIRRIADSDVAASGRLGLEQIAQGYAVPSNPPTEQYNDVRVDPPVAVLADFTTPNAPNFNPDPAVAGAFNLQKTALAQRKGLGVVLPIEIPSNYGNEQQAYFAPLATGGDPLLCTPGKYAPTILGTGFICPDGQPQPCLVPVEASNPSVPKFNCLVNAPVPALSPIRDARVYNLLVLDSTGKFVKDNYNNPNIALSAARQTRVVSAFFRLHTSQITTLGSPTIGINCKKFTSTDQIGCLVEANPCSIGFAGRESVDNVVNFAALIEGIRATSTNISNLVTTPATTADDYPLARTLWLNALNGFSGVTGPEVGLVKCEQGQIPGVPQSLVDEHVQALNFVAVPAGVNRSKTCPAVFP